MGNKSTHKTNNLHVIPIEVKIAKQRHTHGELFHMINHLQLKILKSFEDMHEHTI